MAAQQTPKDNAAWVPDLVIILAGIAVLGYAGIAVALVITTARHSSIIASAALRTAEWVAGAPLSGKAHPWLLSAIPAMGSVLDGQAAKALPDARTEAGNTVSVQPLSPSDDDGLGGALQAPGDTLAAALKRLPASLSLAALKPYAASPTAVPVGLDADGRVIWLDVAASKPNSALHIGLYGASGSGKDTLLRVWFALLCKRNTPSDVQFAILDGKGDWLTANLAELAHMWRAPAGGYGASGDKRIKDAIAAIDGEAERRQALIVGAGCRSREEYITRTGKAMPLLVVLTTDMMTSVAGDVETLLIALVSKARALGIRVIVSMQTPTGKGTQWRMNLSTAIAGALQAGSQDTPALGIQAGDLKYRPSQLPSPQERPGVFVVRRGSEQLLVQAPYLSESRFDEVCATLPRKPVNTFDTADDPSGDDEGGLLVGLLARSAAPPAIVNGNDGNGNRSASESDITTSEPVTVPPHEVAKIAALLVSFPRSEVIKKLPGYSARKYAEYAKKVDTVARMLEGD